MLAYKFGGLISSCCRKETLVTGVCITVCILREDFMKLPDGPVLTSCYGRLKTLSHYGKFVNYSGIFSALKA